MSPQPKLEPSTTVKYYSWDGLGDEKSIKIQGTAEWLGQRTRGQPIPRPTGPLPPG